MESEVDVGWMTCLDIELHSLDEAEFLKAGCGTFPVHRFTPGHSRGFCRKGAGSTAVRAKSTIFCPHRF